MANMYSAAKVVIYFELCKYFVYFYLICIELLIFLFGCNHNMQFVASLALLACFFFILHNALGGIQRFRAYPRHPWTVYPPRSAQCLFSDLSFLTTILTTFLSHIRSNDYFRANQHPCAARDCYYQQHSARINSIERLGIIFHLERPRDILISLSVERSLRVRFGRNLSPLSLITSPRVVRNVLLKIYIVIIVDIHFPLNSRHFVLSNLRNLKVQL